MNLSKREEDLLRRALDKATTDSEADTAAKNLVKELRKRGIDGYQFVEPAPPPRPAPPPPPPRPTYRPPPPERSYTPPPPEPEPAARPAPSEQEFEKRITAFMGGLVAVLIGICVLGALACFLIAGVMWLFSSGTGIFFALVLLVIGVAGISLVYKEKG